MDKLLSAAEVAHQLGIHPKTVARWARQGTLRALRVGPGERPRLRFRQADVQALIQEGKRDR